MKAVKLTNIIVLGIMILVWLIFIFTAGVSQIKEMAANINHGGDDWIFFGLIPLLVFVVAIIYFIMGIKDYNSEKENNGWIKTAIWLQTIFGMLSILWFIIGFIGSFSDTSGFGMGIVVSLISILYGIILIISFLLFLIGKAKQ